MKRLMLLLPLALALAPRAAVAGMPPSPAQVILLEAPSREELRARLMAFGREREKDEPLSAGEAWFYAGMSYDRAGIADSAEFCYQRAIATRGTLEESLRYVDLLFRRQADGDVQQAMRELQRASAPTQDLDPASMERCTARIAWANVLLGRSEDAAEAFAGLSPRWARLPLWQYRMGRALLESGDRRKAWNLVLPAAAISRGQEPDALDLLRHAAPSGAADRVDQALLDEVVKRDRAEGAIVDRLNGRRVRFTAADAFPLGGVVVPPPARGKRPAMVVLRAVEDSLAAYDSLATALRGAGWAVILMDVRGTGWSVGGSCPLPEAWEGREDEMSDAVASDVREGLRALALSAPVDTTRYVVMASGTAALPAALAAERDRRVEALVLLSPEVSPVERGPLRALLARAQIPLFLSQAAEDYLQFELFDAWYQAGNRAASRVADARGPDHGAWPFRIDHSAAPRLIQWLSVKKPARAKIAPPRPAPRRG